MKPNASTGGIRQGKKARRQAAKRTRIALIISGVLLALMLGTFTLTRNVSQARNSVQGAHKKYVATKEIIFDETTRQRRRPTAEETEALVSQLTPLTNRSTSGLTVTSRPDGSKMVNLENRFGGVVLGRANADGTTEVRCVMTMEEAAEFLGLEEVNQ